MSFESIGNDIVAWLAGETWTETINETYSDVLVWTNHKKTDLETHVVPLSVQLIPGTRPQPQRRWTFGIFLLETIREITEDSSKVRRAELMAVVDEIENKLIALRGNLADMDFMFPPNTPRAPIDVDAWQSNIFLAGVVIEVRS